MPVPTGSPTLDRMLGGGLPERRSLLVAGGPGAGKSTLGMQFLDEGLSAGETALYVTTEQTEEEVRTSFEGFAFDLDDPALRIATVRATSDDQLETGEEERAVGTVEGQAVYADGYAAPFTTRYLEEYLVQFIPADRVVFDSLSGLAAIDDRPHHLRRIVLDLIRLFTDAFEATTVFTVERYGDDRVGDGALAGVLAHATNGVIELRRERVRGRARRFANVTKLRGVDHDTRDYEYGITAEGLRFVPGGWSSDPAPTYADLVPTGVPGLDELCGGGLVRGEPVLLEHDGRATVDPLIVGVAAGALEADMSVFLTPPPSLDADRFASMLPDGTDPVPDLLGAERLFVLDAFGVWDAHAGHRNVRQVERPGLLRRWIDPRTALGDTQVRRALREHHTRRDRPVLALMDTEAVGHLLGDAMAIRRLYYWALQSVLGPADTTYFVHNPAAMDARLAEYFGADAAQTIETWTHNRGIQYLEVGASPIGQAGALATVEPSDSPPFVAVTRTVRR